MKLVANTQDAPHSVAVNGQIVSADSGYQSLESNGAVMCYLYNPEPAFAKGEVYHASHGKSAHIDSAGAYGGMLQATSDQSSDYEMGLICLKKSATVTLSDAAHALSGIIRLTY